METEGEEAGAGLGERETEAAGEETAGGAAEEDAFASGEDGADSGAADGSSSLDAAGSGAVSFIGTGSAAASLESLLCRLDKRVSGTARFGSLVSSLPDSLRLVLTTGKGAGAAEAGAELAAGVAGAVLRANVGCGGCEPAERPTEFHCPIEPIEAGGEDAGEGDGEEATEAGLL